MRLSSKAQDALERVIARFQAGDLSPLVEVMQLRLDAGAPAASWSIGNRVLVCAQTGQLDCRGYRQWQQAGRQVRKGARAAYILRPQIVRRDGEAGSEGEEVVVGFAPIPVFSVEDTEPQEGGAEQLPAYVPVELPPLYGVARALGVQVQWVPVPPDRLGDYSHRKGQIRVGTHDPGTFFHELAHAAHYRVCPDLCAGTETVRKEAVAELTAVVLMELYGLGDRSGNSWQYIAHFHEDPLTAICLAVEEVGRVLALLLATVPEGEEPET